MPLKRAELAFLREIIWARLAGTGIHLTEDESGNSNGKISYKGHRIWGIKSLITRMTDDVYNFLLKSMPRKDPCIPETLASALAELAPRYNVSHDILSEKIQTLVGDPHFWSSMDDFQRFSFLIAAFFEALDETRVRLAEETIHTVTLLPLAHNHSNIFPKLIRDLGFAFRAREYAVLFNQICRGGYAKIVKRANKALLKEYRTQMRGQPAPEVTKVIKPERTDFDMQVARLQSAVDAEVLAAISVLKAFGTRAIDPLETLLHHANEDIATKALKVILELKEVPLEDIIMN